MFACTLWATLSGLLFLFSLGLWHVMPFYRTTITGDIPHYLIAVQSLIEDGDFDLGDNYGDPSRHAAFYATPLTPQYAPGTERPYRSIGLPLLLAPGWLLGGHVGALATSAAFLCLVAGGMAALALVDSGRLSLAMAVGVGAVFNLPVVAYLFFPYPDVFSGLAHLWFFLVVTRWLSKSSRPAIWTLAAVLPLAWLVWMHHKFIPLHALHVALVFLWAPRERRWRLSALAAAILASSVAVFIAHRVMNGVDLGGYSADGRFAPWYQALLGMAFDKQFGIFYLFPALALPIAEIVRQLLVGPRRIALTGLVLITALYAHHAWFWGWWGGFSPTGRHSLNYLFILMFFFIPFGIQLIRNPRPWFNLLCGLILVIQVLHTAVMIDTMLLGRLMNMHWSLPPHPPEQPWLEGYTWWGRSQMFWEYGLDEYMPSLIYITSKGLRTLVITATLIGAFAVGHCWADLRARGRPRPRNLAILVTGWILVWGLIYWDLREHHRRRPVDDFIEVWGHPPSHFRNQISE